MTQDARSTRVALNARAAVISNAIGVIVGLAVVPISLRALGIEGYGTFQVLSSLGALALVADVGLGLAVLTRVGQLSGAGRPDEIRELVGAALILIALLVLLLLPVATALLLLMDVPTFLKIPQALHRQAEHGCFIVLLAFTVRMPLSVFASAHSGMQIGNRLVRWTVGGNIAASVGMAIVVTLTKRIDLALAAQATLVLLGSIGAARLGCQLEPSTVPVFKWRQVRRHWALLRSGIVFYILQLEVAIISGLDALVISSIVGVEAVASYTVANRLISLAFSMVYSLGGSFWGAVAHAVGQDDIGWIRTEAARLRRLGTIWMAVMSGGFAAIGPPVIAIWTGNRIQVNPWLAVVLGTYFALLGHTMIDASILNGSERIRQQVVTVGADAILNLTLSLWLVHSLGYVGAGLGTLIAYSICTFLPMQIFSWKLVVRGPRPPFWTRSLTTMVLAIAAGTCLHRVVIRGSGLGPIPGSLVAGTASLLITLSLVRLIVGRDGIEALIRSLRRIDKDRSRTRS